MSTRLLKDIRYIYNTSQDPINDENLEKVISTYLSGGNFYRKLVRINTEKNIPPKWSDIDRIESFFFNLWKNEIVNTDYNEFKQLKIKGVYDDDFLILKNSLTNIPDAKTYRDVVNIRENLLANQDTMYGMIKYDFLANKYSEYWRHIMSSHIRAHKDKITNLEHRLYLNIGREVEYSFIENMVNKFNEKKLPYYFKYTNNSDRGSRDEGVVIYSDSKNLSSYIDVLNEIKKEHKEYEPYIGKPPVLSCVVDGWIGYGSEPLKNPDGKSVSFNEKRKMIIVPTIEEGTKKWIIENKDKEINVNGRNVPYKYYLSNRLTDKFIEKIVIKGLDITNNDIEYASRLSNPAFRDVVNKRFDNHIDEILNNFNGHNLNNYDVKVLIQNEHVVPSTNALLQDVIRDEMQRLNSTDSNYRNYLKTELNSRCERYDVDPRNFAFDLHISDRFRHEERNYRSVNKDVLERIDIKENSRPNRLKVAFDKMFGTDNSFEKTEANKKSIG